MFPSQGGRNDACAEPPGAEAGTINQAQFKAVVGQANHRLFCFKATLRLKSR